MADTGREFLINIGGTPIAGGQENGVSLDGSPVDITSKDDSGFRRLADFSGVKALDISISGVWIDKTFRELAVLESANLLLSDVTVSFADGASLAGDFFLSAYEETGSHEDAVKFTGTLLSSESWTYTAAV